MGAKRKSKTAPTPTPTKRCEVSWCAALTIEGQPYWTVHRKHPRLHPVLVVKLEAKP